MGYYDKPLSSNIMCILVESVLCLYEHIAAAIPGLIRLKKASGGLFLEQILLSRSKG